MASVVINTVSVWLFECGNKHEESFKLDTSNTHIFINIYTIECDCKRILYLGTDLASDF